MGMGMGMGMGVGVSLSLLSTFYLAIVRRPSELGQWAEDPLREQRDCHLENQWGWIDR
jgi:hypothetical protein